MNLSPEKQDTLRNIFVEGQMAPDSVRLEMWETTPSEDKRAEFKKRLDDLEKEYNAKITELLDEIDNKRYQAYEERLPMKSRMEKFNELLDSNERLKAMPLQI